MTVRYAIRAAQPAAHLFHVTVTVAEPDQDGQAFRLPAWIPGSYLVRDFARHIVRLTALAGGRKVAVRKTDKATWRCAPATGELTLAYEVYAWDLSVRAAHLDQTHGFFNGPSVFLAAVGREAQPCRIDILPPAPRSTWRVATGLRRAPSTRAGSFGTYLADDYDELIDCPVEMGTFELGRFEVFGVAHEIALTGRIPRLDLSRLNADVARVCATHARMFEPRQPKLPFDRYTFLTMVVDDGYGGLEHRNSTALLCNRADLPHLGLGDSTEGYRRFLGLASHEYFHAWNVKRIRPAAFVPYDLGRENYTRLLWIFEGFTSYYDDLALARAALLTEAQYLDTLATTLSTVTQRSGRLKQSLGDSSFDSWIKYYRQDENAPNAIVSYYQKGSLVAAALDLAIRAETRGRRSLDDLMRLMWNQFKRAGARYAGIGEEEIAALVEQAVGLQLGRVIREWSDGTRDPDFARLLAPFGIVCDKRPAVDPPHFALLGAQIRRDGAECRLAHVFDGGAAQASGLSAGDALVALDGLRATAGGVDRLLSRYRPGDEIEALAFRRDELMRFSIRLATQPPARYALGLAPAQTEATRRLRRSWLGARG